MSGNDGTPKKFEKSREYSKYSENTLAIQRIAKQSRDNQNNPKIPNKSRKYPQKITKISKKIPRIPKKSGEYKKIRLSKNPNNTQIPRIRKQSREYLKNPEEYPNNPEIIQMILWNRKIRKNSLHN